MSDEEYSFLNIRRSTRKIHLMMKHSTPLTKFYMSSLPTVDEWEEDSYFANHNHKMDPQQVKPAKAILPRNCEETGISSKNVSPLPETQSPAEDERFSGEDLEREIKLNAKYEEDINLDISTLRMPKKYYKRKKLRNLLIKKKVAEWVVQQLNNIEEATYHNLVIENV